MDEQSGGCCTVNSGGSSQEFLISGFGSSDGHSKEILGTWGVAPTMGAEVVTREKASEKEGI